MKIAISQSNYIPWKGYFDNIATVDKFVLYDCMQYTKRDWRNRNKINTSNGLTWLSIPVEVKGKYSQTIKDTKIADKSWNKKHLNSIKHAYSKAPCYNECKDWLEELFQTADYGYLSEVNYHFLTKIFDYLGLKYELLWSSDFLLEGDKNEKLISICEQIGASEYYTGGNAKGYMDESLFNNKGITVKYYDYSDYKEYPHLTNQFEHGVTILDLILHQGKNSINYMKSSK